MIFDLILLAVAVVLVTIPALIGKLWMARRGK
jgi:hypothetical protein